MSQVVRTKQGRQRLIYAAMSLLVVWHTLAMLLESAPSSVITLSLRVLFNPYLALFRLENQWGFFAPDVELGAQFRYVVEDAAGTRHTFVPAEKLSRFSPASIWFRDRYKLVSGSIDTYGDHFAAALCREHAALNPISITFLEIVQKDFSPADRLRGKHPLDSEFVDVNPLKTVQCQDK
jgi:hypothetical protein